MAALVGAQEPCVQQQQQEQQQQPWLVRSVAQEGGACTGGTPVPLSRCCPFAHIDLTLPGREAEVDWVTLGSMRKVLKPKICVLQGQEAHMPSEGGPMCVRQLPSRQPLPSQGQEEKQRPAQPQPGQQQQHSRNHEQQQQRQLGLQEGQQDLFNSLVANPRSHGVIALAHEAHVLLPPQARFIMGDLMDKRTLAPLLTPAGVCVRACVRACIHVYYVFGFLISVEPALPTEKRVTLLGPRSTCADNVATHSAPLTRAACGCLLPLEVLATPGGVPGCPGLSFQ